MAKLVDPDDLAQGTSVIITPEAITDTQGTSGTIKLQPGQERSDGNTKGLSP